MNTEKKRVAGGTGRNGARIDSARQNLTEDGEVAMGTVVKNCAVSTLIAMGIALVLLLIFALISYSNPDPDQLAFPLSLVALYIGALTGGIITSRKTKERILLGGIISGLMYLFMIFAISLTVASGNNATAAVETGQIAGVNSQIANAAIVVVSILGSLLGVRHKIGNSAKKHKLPKGYKN